MTDLTRPLVTNEFKTKLFGIKDAASNIVTKGLSQLCYDGTINITNTEVKQRLDAIKGSTGQITAENIQDFFKLVDTKEPTVLKKLFAYRGETDPDKARKVWVAQFINNPIPAAPSVSAPPPPPGVAFDNLVGDFANSAAPWLGVSKSEIVGAIEPAKALIGGTKELARSGLAAAPGMAKAAVFGIAFFAMMSGGGPKSLGGWMSGLFALAIGGILCAALFSQSPQHQRSHDTATPEDPNQPIHASARSGARSYDDVMQARNVGEGRHGSYVPPINIQFATNDRGHRHRPQNCY